MRDILIAVLGLGLMYVVCQLASGIYIVPAYFRALEYAGCDMAEIRLRGGPSNERIFKGITSQLTLLIHRSNTLAQRLEDARLSTPQTQEIFDELPEDLAQVLFEGIDRFSLYGEKRSKLNHRLRTLRRAASSSDIPVSYKDRINELVNDAKVWARVVAIFGCLAPKEFEIWL